MMFHDRKYNPDIHHRRSIRLKGYDYSQAGMYFVTICVNNHECLFGKIINGEMMLNDAGEIAHNEWIKLSERYPNVVLDVFQIMPNHVHGIIILKNMTETTAEMVGATLAVAHDKNAVAHDKNAVAHDKNAVAHDKNAVTHDKNAVTTNENTNARNNAANTHNNAANDNNSATARVAPTIGNIIGAYKSLVVNRYLEICKMRNEYMGKLWQRNYWERIIRNEPSYQHITKYIVNNPANWKNDEFYTK